MTLYSSTLESEPLKPCCVRTLVHAALTISNALTNKVTRIIKYLTKLKSGLLHSEQTHSAGKRSTGVRS